MTASTRQISPQSTSQSPEPAEAICDQLAPNQVPPLTGYNLFLSDRTLVQAVEREDAGWAREQITELGQFLGTEEAQRWGFEANENKPVLHTHDRFGNRRDEVVFHPSWHNLMRTSVANRLHCLPWEVDTASATGGVATGRPGAHVARAAARVLSFKKRSSELRGFSCEPTIRVVEKLKKVVSRFSRMVGDESPDKRLTGAKERKG